MFIFWNTQNRSLIMHKMFSWITSNVFWNTKNLSLIKHQIFFWNEQNISKTNVQNVSFSTQNFPQKLLKIISEIHKIFPKLHNLQKIHETFSTLRNLFSEKHKILCEIRKIFPHIKLFNGFCWALFVVLAVKCFHRTRCIFHVWQGSKYASVVCFC